MPLENFPTLTSGVIANWKHQPAFDPTIRDDKEAGYVQTRPRFTAVPESWSFILRLVSQTDKNLIFSFEKTTVNYGGNSFSWNNSQDGNIYEVRFQEVVKYKLESQDPSKWDITISVVEAYPNASI